MASEIRANKQTNRVGLGTVTYTDTGIIVSGIVTANSFKGDGSQLTGITIPGGNNGLDLNDNIKIRLGTASDKLEIYHSGTGAAILNSKTSTQLTIASDNALNLTSRTGTEYYFRAYPNSRAELYFDYSTYNTPKLQTSATGVTVDGTVAATAYTGDGSQLSNLPASAPVGGSSSNKVFFENDKVISVNYQITSTKNAMTAGPVSVNAGIAVTVPSGCSWTIV